MDAMKLFNSTWYGQNNLRLQFYIATLNLESHSMINDLTNEDKEEFNEKLQRFMLDLEDRVVRRYNEKRQ